MIEYRETKKTKLNYIKKFTLFYCGPFFILGVAILLASVFCNLIPGISGDKAELIYAIMFISLDILIFMVGPLLLYRRLYNILIFPIRDCSDEYYEELSIEYCEEKYIFKNLTIGNVLVFNKKEIKKANLYKDILIIFFTGKRIKIIPATKETKALFTDFL